MFNRRLARLSSKALFVFLLFLLSMIFLAASAFAAVDSKSISVMIDGKEQQYEQSPLIEKGHTLVPLRAIFEALGAEIKWNAVTRTATATKDDIEVVITIGQKTAYVNSRPQLLDVSAQIINGHTMVPLRFISQAFGAYVNWRPSTNTVAIKTTRITPETSKLQMPLKAVESAPIEAVTSPNGIPQIEEAVLLKAPLNPPLATPMFTVPLSELSRNWKSFDTVHFRIYYYDQEREQDIIIQSQYFDEIYEILLIEFGHPMPEQIPVYFYNETDYLAIKELPPWSIAAWEPATDSMKIKLEAAHVNNQDLMSFRHELTHAITLSSIDSSLYEAPTWFMEGAATYFEQAQPYYDLARSRVLYKALQDNKLIAFSDIAADSTKWLEADVGLIYAEAQSFYGYLVAQYGETNINEIYYTADNFTKVIDQITNHSLADLEASWKLALAQSYSTATPLNGQIFFMEGAWYEGGIKNGLQEGQGKYFDNDKLVYSGEYKDGKFEGQGVFFYKGGAVYKGEMKAGSPNGYGKYYWAEGDHYEGNLVNGEFEGQGIYYWINGDVYTGEWKAGKQNGQGTIRNADGSDFSGLFIDGEIAYS
ncbi:stalk domain-containing protein [Paenibacillus psychroresistens]|nr:stalk domain-containing protein [Paenibacillus psychroresistens]